MQEKRIQAMRQLEKDAAHMKLVGEGMGHERPWSQVSDHEELIISWGRLLRGILEIVEGKISICDC